MLIRAALAALVSVAAPAPAEPENINWPNYREGDSIISNYKFASGETLPQLKLHYRTLGSAERNAAIDVSWLRQSFGPRGPSRHQFHELPNVLMTPHARDLPRGPARGAGV